MASGRTDIFTLSALGSALRRAERRLRTGSVQNEEKAPFHMMLHGADSDHLSLQLGVVHPDSATRAPHFIFRKAKKKRARGIWWWMTDQNVQDITEKDDSGDEDGTPPFHTQSLWQPG